MDLRGPFEAPSPFLGIFSIEPAQRASRQALGAQALALLEAIRSFNRWRAMVATGASCASARALRSAQAPAGRRSVNRCSMGERWRWRGGSGEETAKGPRATAGVFPVQKGNP